MKVSFQVDKITKFTIILILFSSGQDVDEEVLRRLLLIKNVIKDDNMMCVSFTVKHRHRHISGIVKEFVR